VPVEDALPPDLLVVEHLGGTAEGRAWLDALPARVAELEARWQVRTGAPYRAGMAAWTAPATMPDGSEAVLKVSWPHREARGEAAALQLWGGAGAVRLLAEDADAWALLVECCTPGTAVHDSGLDPYDALRASADVLLQLWSATPPEGGFEPLTVVTDEWAALVRERMARHRPPFDGKLIEAGAALLEELPRSATRTVLLHGDFNPGNILRSGRQPYLAIDPKPMVGDPGYDPSPLLLQVDPPFEHADPAAVLRARYHAIADMVGEDEQRLLAWSVARLVEAALWRVDTGRHGELAGAMEEIEVLASLAGV
jgi:streptomycin 6-kinase